MRGPLVRASCRERAAALAIACQLPLLALAMVERPFVALAVFAISGGVAIAASGLVIGGALDRLAHTIDAWRGGSAFDPSRERAPAEMAALIEAVMRGESRLRQREAELVDATAQQDLMMQEIHHRVKNNLQIVASLLNLQASRIRSPAARAEFQSARDRVRALATVHRHLYAHGELHTINLREFLTELCGQLFSAFGEAPGVRIGLHIAAPELQMSSDQAVPLALIVTEVVSNAVKYAFPDGRRGAIAVELTADESSAVLSVHDDGVGIEAARAAGGEGRREGIGLQLIRGFTRQLGATLAVEEGEGTRYTVRLPLRRKRAPLAPIGSRPAACPAA